mmetsp:Transcript_17550/g.31489  ORF Transcript_17550/g.31489 Transcript_17550/m.31489 type:complete len:250 (-) Transcript_17550:655-1404(-)
MRVCPLHCALIHPKHKNRTRLCSVVFLVTLCSLVFLDPVRNAHLYLCRSLGRFRNFSNAAPDNSHLSNFISLVIQALQSCYACVTDSFTAEGRHDSSGVIEHFQHVVTGLGFNDSVLSQAQELIGFKAKPHWRSFCVGIALDFCPTKMEDDETEDGRSSSNRRWKIIIKQNNSFKCCCLFLMFGVCCDGVRCDGVRCWLCCCAIVLSFDVALRSGLIGAGLSVAGSCCMYVHVLHVCACMCMRMCMWMY